MRLIQARLRCLEGVADSGWFKLGRRLTILHGGDSATRLTLLQGLESLNPAYDCDLRRPYRNHLETWRQGTRTRRVIPGKKTAVVGVFGADSSTVRALSRIDDDLFETDRVQVGRRLDHSRWVSFVELSQSARWRDIEKKMHFLKEMVYSKEKELTSSSWPTGLTAVSRIKGEVAEGLENWLLQMRPLFAGAEEEDIEYCLHEVQRSSRFRLASRVVLETLPVLIFLAGSNQLAQRYTFHPPPPQHSEDHPTSLLWRATLARYGLAGPGGSRQRRQPFDRAVKACLARVRRELPSEVPLPHYGDDGLQLPAAAELTGGRHLLAAVGLTCLLANLATGRYPLLLLAEPGQGLDSREAARLLSTLGELGGVCQLLISRAAPPGRPGDSSLRLLELNGKGEVHQTDSPLR